MASFNKNKNKCALIIHSDLNNSGGAEDFCVHVIEILQGNGFHVTVVHSGNSIDIKTINKRYGVLLKRKKLNCITAFPFNIFPNLFKRLILLRYSFVLRYAAKMIKHFDIIIGTFGEVPIYSKKVIQIGHVPLFFFDKQSLQNLGVNSNNPLTWFLRVIYVIAARAVANWSRAAVCSNMLLANSQWTKRQFIKRYIKITSKVLYHGVNIKKSTRDILRKKFSKRYNNFVMIGRLSSFKRYEFAIKIISALRNQGHNIKLLIFGNGQGSYANQIQEIAKKNKYIKVFNSHTKVRMENEILKHKWGIHAAINEHYGLAPIELQRLGCVTFVHKSGGPLEVIKNKNLVYNNKNQAIKKINIMLNDEKLAKETQKKQYLITNNHTKENFKKQFCQELKKYKRF